MADRKVYVEAQYDKDAPEHRILPLGYREVDQKTKA